MDYIIKKKIWKFVDAGEEDMEVKEKKYHHKVFLLN